MNRLDRGIRWAVKAARTKVTMLAQARGAHPRESVGMVAAPVTDVGAVQGSDTATSADPLPDLGRLARERLGAAGLLGPVVGAFNVVNDMVGDEMVQVTISMDASYSDVERVRDALGTIPHRIVRGRPGSS
jgi:hypothetical protein